MTKNEALAGGFRKYNTGRPCVNGHYSDRYTLGGMCIACLKMHQARNKIKATQLRVARLRGFISHTVTVRAEHAGIVDHIVKLLSASPESDDGTRPLLILAHWNDHAAITNYAEGLKT